MTTEIELLPCPLCEGEAAAWLHSNSDWRVRCRSCTAHVLGWATKHRASMAWNTRKPIERLASELEVKTGNLTREIEHSHLIEKEKASLTSENEALREALEKAERRLRPHEDDTAQDDSRDKRLAHMIVSAALSKKGEGE